MNRDLLPLLPLRIASEVPEEAELIMVGCFEGLEGLRSDLPNPLEDRIRGASNSGRFSGREGQTTSDAGEGRVPVWLHGLGAAKDFEARKMKAWLERSAEAARINGYRQVLWILPDHEEAHGADAAERVLRYLRGAPYRYDRLQEPKERERIEGLWVWPEAAQRPAFEEAQERAGWLAEGIAFTRDLANTPGNEATPVWMVEQAKTRLEGLGYDFTVFDEEELESRGMGGILAVGGGSCHPPRMLILRRNGGGPKVAVVGKGVTFDAGGLSLKPALDMDEMKYDKAGSCAVLGIALAAARMNLPLDLRFYLPFAENMPDGKAYRPGDVVRCYNGKTVEITNTDAEGRMLLADAMALAVEEGAESLIELSTLTGACVVALGNHGGGLFSPDDELVEQLTEAAEATGERIWRLPIWPEFADEMKGNHADLKNSGSRWGGASTAAAFLANFVGDLEAWAHLDIAGPASSSGDGAGQKGATGFGVATSLRWLRDRAS